LKKNLLFFIQPSTGPAFFFSTFPGLGPLGGPLLPSPFPAHRPAPSRPTARPAHSAAGPARLRASAPTRPSSTAARMRSAFSAYARTRRSSSPSLPAGPTPSDARASAARTRHFSLSLRSRPHPSAATVPFPFFPAPLFPFSARQWRGSDGRPPAPTWKAPNHSAPLPFLVRRSRPPIKTRAGRPPSPFSPTAARARTARRRNTPTSALTSTPTCPIDPPYSPAPVGTVISRF